MLRNSGREREREREKEMGTVCNDVLFHLETPHGRIVGLHSNFDQITFHFVTSNAVIIIHIWGKSRLNIRTGIDV